MPRPFMTAIVCLLVAAIGPLTVLSPAASMANAPEDVVATFAAAPAMPGDAAQGAAMAFGYAGPAPQPVPQESADDVALNLTGFTSAFGAEVYKYGDRTNSRDAAAVENQTTVWETAIGHSITATVVAQAGDSTLNCNQVLIPEAYIATSAGRLHGFLPGSYDPAAIPCTSGLPATRTFPLTFDLDGTPATIGGVESPALLPGVYSILFNVYYQVARTPQNPGGVGPLAGATRIDFALATPQLTPVEPPLRFPEQTLRMFSDVGASFASANEYVMLPGPLRTSGETNVTVAFPGVLPGTTFERVDHWAQRRGPDAAAPVALPSLIADETPLDEAVGKVENQDGRGGALVVVTAERPNLNNNSVPPAGAVVMPVRGNAFARQAGPTEVAAYTPLQLMTIHVPATRETMTTGASSLVVAVSDNEYPIRGIDSAPRVPGVAQTGVTTIRIQDAEETSGGPAGTNAGDLFALRPIGFGHDLVTQGRISREPGNQWMSAELNHLAIADPVSQYRILGMMYGAQDEFYGLTMASRGIGLEVQPLRMAEDKAGELRVVVRNLADDGDGVLGENDFAIQVSLSAVGLPSGEAYNVTLVEPIPEGGAALVVVPIAGAAPNVYNVVFTARSGELSATQDTTVEIISKERAREENRKWYSVPGPELGVIALALVALAGLVRRRV